MNDTATGGRARFGSAPGIADRIERHILARGLEPGEHLSAQALADLVGASRTPVNNALRLLASQGKLRHEPNRGFFVDAVGGAGPGGASAQATDAVELAYAAMVRDRLDGSLGEEVKENELRARYGLTKSQLQILLSRVMQEGWIERRAGYGWAFTEMLTTSEALSESFRLRLVLEPASLLQPGYHLSPHLIAECRRTELAMLRGGLNTMPLDALFERGSRFHEVLVSGSHNRFFLDTVKRVNRIRRLLSYQAMDHRERYIRQSEEHLVILDLIEQGRLEEAAEAVRQHLATVHDYYAATLADRHPGDTTPKR